jgi:DNA-binding MarR family transcriptional regulator
LTTVSPDRPGSEERALDGPANVFGALALIVADQMADAVAEAAGRADSAPAALAALHHFLDSPSVDLLRQVLGLTSSGTVRLLDRLASAGLIERGPGPDGRTTAVTLTPEGHAAAAGVCGARADVLERALETLTPDERATFSALAGKVLVGMMRGPGAVQWMCRLCDTGICRGAPGGCPVGNEAVRRHGTAASQPRPQGAFATSATSADQNAGRVE